MARPYHREIAPTIVFDASGRFLLQQRDDIPGILCPGQIGLFGGHREGDESFLGCAVRELAEELSMAIPADRFEFLTSRHGEDHEVVGGTVEAHFFVVRNVPADKIVVTEGRLHVAKWSELGCLAGRLTPMAGYALDFYKSRFGSPQSL